MRNKERNSCKCGCGLPVGEGREYVDRNHKQRAYRARGRNQKRALSKYISVEINSLLGEEKANKVFHHLNQVAGDKYNYEIDKALVVLVTELRIAKEEAKNAQTAK